MNARQEQRVIEALQALTGGLAVTEHDMLVANNKLKDNLEPPSPRRRLIPVAVVAAAAVVAGFVLFQVVDSNNDAAPPPTSDTSPAEEALVAALDENGYGGVHEDFNAGSPPSAQDLVGLWLLRAPYSGPLAVQTDLDWTHENIGNPKAFSSSTLDGRSWIRKRDGLDAACRTANGQPGLPALPWDASMAGDGSLHLAFAGAPHQNSCTPADDREVWDRLVPGPSAIMDYFLEVTSELSWQIPMSEFSLSGIYVNVKDGTVLEILDGRFFYIEGIGKPGAATSSLGRLDHAAEPGALEGSCGSAEFNAGLRVGWTPAVTQYVEAHRALQITAPTGDTCRTFGIDGVWVSLY